jgi:carboxyl-terminal processing protease
MLAASNRSGGQNFGFPDVCNTPVGSATVPLPYPNVAAHAQATGFATTVKIENMNALTLSASIPQTTGDEAGTAHSNFMQKGQFTTGSSIVFIEKQPGIHLTNVTTGNAMNQSGGAVVVSGSTTVFYTLAAPGVARVDEAGATALRDAIRGSDDVVTGSMCDETTGLVRIARFTSDVATRVDREIRRLAGRGLTALVLDVRDNPGGELDAAVRLAEDFLPEGAVIAILTDADGDETVLRARRGAGHTMPLVLLVDAGTASAAELFAFALKAHGRASIAGEATYGKATVQRPVAAADGGLVHATVAVWRTPADV